MTRWSLVLIAVVVGSIGLAVAQYRQEPAAGHEEMKLNLHFPGELKWMDGPAALPRGGQFALLEGDPAKEGPFVFRAKWPDGYRVPPHTHPKTERITVISGTFNIGMGEKFDEASMKSMPAGSYGHWPAGMTHFASAAGETIIQVHGIGPWQIKYVNPADDPRLAKKE
jgi:hypothetical protein